MLSESLRYDPFSAEAHEDPYPLYRQLRDEAPVYRTPDHGIWVISRYDDVQACARAWETFSNAPGVDLGGFVNLFGTGDFLDVDPPSHSALRNVIRHHFTPRAITELEAVTRRYSDALLHELAGEGEVDMATRYAIAMPVLVVSHLIGIDADDRAPIFALCEQLIQQPPGQMDPTAEQRAAATEVRERLGALARRGGRPGTILGDVSAAVEGGELSLAEAEGMLLLVCVAGFETTAALLTHAMYLLDGHPDQRALLMADRSLIPDAIEEIVRFESPIQVMARTVSCETELHGFELPAGDRAVLLFGAANRDERRFVDPDRFDITRPKLRHLGFGEGIHHCLGAPLARLEGRVMLEELLTSFPEYEVVGPIERPASHNGRGISTLPVRLR
jgi:cytochrome P450